MPLSTSPNLLRQPSNRRPNRFAVWLLIIRAVCTPTIAAIISLAAVQNAFGIRDYSDFFGKPAAGTPGGLPITYTGNQRSGYVGSYANTITFVRPTDDIDEDGIPGAIIVVDPKTGQLTTLTDFGDLHTFNIGFEEYRADQYPGSQAVDVINVAWLGADEGNSEGKEGALAASKAAEALNVRNWETTGFEWGSMGPYAAFKSDGYGSAPELVAPSASVRKNGIGLLYGFRAINTSDDHSVFADGGILGRSFWITGTENRVFGPQAGVVWLQSRGPWSVRLQGLALAGYNLGRVEQYGGIGEELVPGAINRFLYAQPTYFTHTESSDRFSPSGELAAETSLQVTKSIAIRLVWSGIVIDNVLLPDDRVRYFLPNMGLLDPGNQRLFVQNIFCGIEVVR
jgi:hypothetical protein